MRVLIAHTFSRVLRCVCSRCSRFSVIIRLGEERLVVLFESKIHADGVHMGRGSALDQSIRVRLYWISAPAGIWYFPNPAEIQLRQKSHRNRIVLPDLKS